MLVVGMKINFYMLYDHIKLIHIINPAINLSWNIIKKTEKKYYYIIQNDDLQIINTKVNS